ncbi:ras association domain-containing protein 2 isoform X3 [Myotis myotis]|uniref:ras association domain-containing protein 2 isoform X3 n=1 Tax=Myotis myotis TaxID=51298 RepID=UPI00174D8561|nr:ras association domain-containing protein 2 isoform X3 [Myotis myotis]
MDYSHQTSLVPCGKDKYISKNELLLHLKTYNLYYEGQNLQLRHREEEDEFIVEGLLNISWGLRRPIRLQMQDDNERIRPPPSSSSWHSGCNLGAQGTVLKPITMPDIQITEVDAPAESDQMSSPTDSRDLKPVQEDTPQLMRTRSDVGVRRRGNVRTTSDQRRIRRHRFSINGHFYNHKTSVFTPAYGSVTNVRINSTMTTPQVLKLLLNKFKIENSAEEFALYVVHTSGGDGVFLSARQAADPNSIKALDKQKLSKGGKKPIGNSGNPRLARIHCQAILLSVSCILKFS